MGGAETYLRNLVPALLSLRPDLRFELATTRRGAAALAAEPWAEEVTLLRLPCDDDQPLRRTLVGGGGTLCGGSATGLAPDTQPLQPGSANHALRPRDHSPRRDLLSLRDDGLDKRSWHALGGAPGRPGADAVIAVSEVAADDIARTLGIDRQRVTPIPHGAGQTAAGAPPPRGGGTLRG